MPPLQRRRSPETSTRPRVLTRRQCDCRPVASKETSSLNTRITPSTTPRITPFTVSVYPIEQEPGVWFANYMISEYHNGTERIVANVSMRHATHRSESNAKQAARRAGEHAAARLRRQQR